MMMKHPKALVIRDDIHGDIFVPVELKAILEHPIFQRLRHIGQTGLLYLVYPGMRHCRFEHSLGAMKLALEWYDTLTRTFQEPEHQRKFLPIQDNHRRNDGSEVLFYKTQGLMKALTGQNGTEWRMIVSAAALLHDVGHGPFSHSLEQYGVLTFEGHEDFVSTPSVVAFLKKRMEESEKERKKTENVNKKKLLNHEDFSLAFGDKILGSTEFFVGNERRVLCVLALLHKDFKSQIVGEQKKGELKNITSEDLDYIAIFSHIISGLFDVDRLDYLERDSKKAGVNYGLVESQRIMSSLIPMFFKVNDREQVGLLTRARMVHALDHFLVCLFELYTQLYTHPSYEGYQFELGLLVKRAVEIKALKLSAHEMSTATDNFVAEQLNMIGGARFFDRLVKRQFRDGRVVFQTYSDGSAESGALTTLKKIGESSRDILKGDATVWLVDTLPPKKPSVITWDNHSIVAKGLKREKYAPSIWWSNSSYEAEVAKLVQKDVGTSKSEGTG